MKHSRLIILIVFLIVASAVGWAIWSPSQTTAPATSIIPPPEDVPFSLPTKADTGQVSYRALTLTTDKPGKEIADSVGMANMQAVFLINRVDAGHLSKGAVMSIPDSFDDPTAFSSFPATISDLAAVPKIMLVSQRVQAFGIYEHGELIRFGPVSTGKKTTPTPSRLYFTNWKGKLVTSTVDNEWIMPWYFNLDNKEGISMHQLELPGYPASHACIRLTEDDAKFIYDWADQWKLSADDVVIAHGTPVLVFGTYAYGVAAPWKNLPSDLMAVTITADELTKALEPHLAEIAPTPSTEE